MTVQGRTPLMALLSALIVGALLGHGPAVAQGLLPANFFNAPLTPGGEAAVEADNLEFDSNTRIIRATGNVVLLYQGYTVKGDTLIFDRRTDDVHMAGAVQIIDPAGNVLDTTDLEVTGGMKQAFLDALTITATDGSRITADSADYDAVLETVLQNAGYAPCGDCIDDQGRRVGWSMKAARVIKNSEDGSVMLEQPSLSILGIPVAWTPFLWLPSTDADVLANLRMPTYDYEDKTGHKVEIPVSVYATRSTDVILTPTLMSRQGFLLGAEWIQRFQGGSFQIKASGLYQRDQSAYAGTVGDRPWRGAIQTSGEFTPIENWKVGFSYVDFTDAAYLTDYRLTVGKSSVTEVYATHLNSDTYFDIRLQQFNQLGNVTAAQQGQQARTLPVTRFSHVQKLAPGMGQLEFDGQLLNVQREVDMTTNANGVPYQLGLAGNKTRATFQLGWEKQIIAGGGLVATPYLGARTDLAYYDGTSPLMPGPTSQFTATPIAAIDLRYPLMSTNGPDVHIFEPIAQLAYRGSDTTRVGITNDDAMSFVFDDTNLFSYNRFSGYDRQETGLRANIGGRYQASLGDGRYLEFVGGQSFQLAGPNAFATVDGAQTAVGGGLSNGASYAVLGAYGAPAEGVKLGGKVQVDTGTWQVARAGASSQFTTDYGSATLDYNFIAANAAVGTIKDQHQVTGSLTLPVADYWSVKANAGWDLQANTWLVVGGGIEYDDGYLVLGANASRTGSTHSSPNNTTLSASFRIKAPAGFNLGYTGAVPVPPPLR